jgi:hypothetical protein
MAPGPDRNPPKSRPAEDGRAHVAFLWEGDLPRELVGAIKEAFAEVVEELGLAGTLTVTDLTDQERARISAEADILARVGRIRH